MAVQKRKVFRRATRAKCSFCERAIDPTYKEPEILGNFVTERGKLLGRARTGLCQKHQKKLTVAVKRARHLAYLPFVAHP